MLGNNYIRDTYREWLSEWVNEVSNMESVFGEALFSQLALVEIVDEQTNCTVESIRTT